MARKKTSKSKRIQDYLAANPEARNREVVEILSAHGVTAADVSNAKTQMKRKLESASIPVGASAATSSDSKHGKITGNRKRVGGRDLVGAISLEELQLTAGYIKAVGGLDRAQQLIQMVQQIQEL